MKLKNFFALGLLLVAGNVLATTHVNLKVNNSKVFTGRPFNNGEKVEACTLDGMTVALTVTEGEKAEVILGFEKDGATHSMTKEVEYGVAYESKCSEFPEYSVELTVDQVKSVAETPASQE